MKGFWHQYERIGSISSTLSAVAQCARAVNPHSDPQKHLVKLMILGSFLKKPCFFNDILLSYQFPLVRPSCELGLPKCLPNASQMSPKCFPDASKMPLRWLSDAFQIPDASQMPPKSCSIAFSSMILLHRSHSSMMTKDNSDINDVFSYMILLHWPLFHDSSSWFIKTCLGSRAGVICLTSKCVFF